MATTLSSTPATGCQAAGRKLTSQCRSRTKIWSKVSIIVYAPSPAMAAALATAASAALLALASALTFSAASRASTAGRFGGMNPVIILVRLSQLLAVEQQPAKAVRRAQLKLGIHLDGFKGANLDADLAAHANRNINVEFGRIKLRLAQCIRLFVRALDNINALRRAFLLADLAGHAAQPGLPIRAVRFDHTQGRERRAPPRWERSAAPDTRPSSAARQSDSCRRSSSPSPPCPSVCPRLTKFLSQ